MSIRILITALLLWPCLALAQAEETAKPADAPPSASLPLSEDQPAPESNAVILQGLNKVTGRTSKLQGPLGTVMNFGTLEIIVRRCWKASPEERPENAALIEIREMKSGEEQHQIFLGWMFSSSPGLSGLEHPVYDVNLISCETLKDPEKPEKKK